MHTESMVAVLLKYCLMAAPSARMNKQSLILLVIAYLEMCKGAALIINQQQKTMLGFSAKAKFVGNVLLRTLEGQEILPPV